MKNQKSRLGWLSLLLGLIAVAVVVYNARIAYDSRFEAGGDAYDYLQLGVGIAKTGTYGVLDVTPGELLKDFRNENVASKEYRLIDNTAFRPPVWPFLIGGIFSLFGYELSYLILFKFLLHLLGIFIFYKTLTLIKTNKGLAVIGTFIYAVSPAWQLYSRVFLSEPVTLFFLTLWLFFLLRYIFEEKAFFPQAIAGGILILAHPYYIFLPFSVWFILLLQKQIKWKNFIISSALFAAVVSVWIIRNFVVLNTSQIALTTSSGAVIAKGWNSEIPENHTNTKGDLADEELVLKDFNSTAYGSSEVQRMQLYKDATIHFIKENPHLILPIILKKLKSAFNPFPETPRPGILETGRVIFHLLALLSIIYILVCSRNKIMLSITYGLILSTVAITILTYSGFRFRMPQTVLELILIVYALQMGYTYWNSHRKSFPIFETQND